MENYVKYYFFYINREGEEYRFYNLSKRKAIIMYNTFIRDMTIHEYKKVGWGVDE